jgi:hypothetical protein
MEDKRPEMSPPIQIKMCGGSVNEDMSGKQVCRTEVMGGGAPNALESLKQVFLSKQYFSICNS